MLWRRALRCSPAPSNAELDGGTGAHDGLVHVLAIALADLIVIRGDNELAAAALRILFDPRLAAWYGATAAEASRPPRVASAAQRLALVVWFAPGSSLGVRALPASQAAVEIAASPLALARSSLACAIRAAAAAAGVGAR